MPGEWARIWSRNLHNHTERRLLLWPEKAAKKIDHSQLSFPYKQSLHVKPLWWYINGCHGGMMRCLGRRKGLQSSHEQPCIRRRTALVHLKSNRKFRGSIYLYQHCSLDQSISRLSETKINRAYKSTTQHLKNIEVFLWREVDWFFNEAQLHK